MMSPDERLVHMANQIARNIALPGDAAAGPKTAEHIATFWDPGMRATLLAGDGSRLSAVASRAVAMLREEGSRRGTIATGRSGGSDAG